MKKIKIGLFFGGMSDERAVSLVTGKTIAEQLDLGKYEITPIEVAKEGDWLLASPAVNQIYASLKVKNRLAGKKLSSGKDWRGLMDIAFLALHGPGGEDGTIQGALEMMQIPYTGSGVLASALAMDKSRTKKLVEQAGVRVLPELVISRLDYQKNKSLILQKLKGSLVVKPGRLGSSIGVKIVTGKNQLESAVAAALKLDREILIEPYMPGRELTVPVIGNEQPKVLPAIEIVPWEKAKFYDYDAKYKSGGSEHIIPAPVSGRLAEELYQMALVAHKTLGCRGVTRSDFIADEKGKCYFLEINTIPGMTPTSLVPQSAESAGIEFTQLLDRIIKLAGRDLDV